MFTMIIVRPIFNLLVAIYALLPGHNFGLSIIIFTVVVRLLMWPLVKKQLHHARAMRELQPELKRIKQAAKGNRQQESVMVMELYKERQINPFSSLGIILLQLPVLIGLYIGLRKIVNNPEVILSFSYPWLHHLGWIEQLKHNIHLFDNSLFGIIDLTKPALGKHGGFYLPAFAIVLGSAIGQYFQTQQLMPTDKNGKSLRGILKEAGQGKKSDQSEVNAAVGQSTKFLIPFMILIFTISLPAALPLYWLATSVVAVIQQGRVLRRDETELVSIADKPSSTAKVVEGEVIAPPKAKKPKKAAAKRRKRR